MDTNVLVSALRSQRGASFRLLSLVDGGGFQLCVSVPLILEYEAAAKRLCRPRGLSRATVDTILDYLCRVGVNQRVYYLWRPILRDPGDDMVLELAVAAGAKYIATYNKADFAGSDRFAVRVVTPAQFLRSIGERP